MSESNKTQLAVNLANNFLPTLLQLVIEDDLIVLKVRVNTGIVDTDGLQRTVWKTLSEMCHIDSAMTFLDGFIKGIETIGNFERIMLAQAESERLKAGDQIHVGHA